MGPLPRKQLQDGILLYLVFKKECHVFFFLGGGEEQGMLLPSCPARLPCFHSTANEQLLPRATFSVSTCSQERSELQGHVYYATAQHSGVAPDEMVGRVTFRCPFPSIQTFLPAMEN